MPRRSLEERALTQAISVVPSTTSLALGPGTKPSNPKAALRRCCNAWQRAFDACLASEEGDECDRMWAARPAGVAYCNAMPMLVGYEGVRDLIACAAHGILIGAIDREKSAPHLYAAQVALGTLHHAPKPATIPPRPRLHLTPCPSKPPLSTGCFHS